MNLRRDNLVLTAGTLAIATLLFVACGGSSSTATPKTAVSTAASSSTTQAVTTTAKQPDDFVMKASDFTNLRRMTHVRGFFVDNKLGHLAVTLSIARGNVGGRYPVGTIVQLVPNEAMVKRRVGFSPKSNDWEFFSLDVSKTGTKIIKRGGAELVSQFTNTSCAACHGRAKPKFDFVCENTHGCAPLGIGDDVIKRIQNTDPRP